MLVQLEASWSAPLIIDRLAPTVQERIKADMSRCDGLTLESAIVWKANLVSTVHEDWQIAVASLTKIDPVANFVKMPTRAPDPTARQIHNDLRLPIGEARVFFTPMQMDMDRSVGDSIYIVTPDKYRRHIPSADSSLPQSQNTLPGCGDAQVEWG